MQITKSVACHIVWVTIAANLLFLKTGFAQTTYSWGPQSSSPCAGPNASYITYYGTSSNFTLTCTVGNLGSVGDDYEHASGSPTSNGVQIRWLKAQDKNIYFSWSDGHQESLHIVVTASSTPQITVSVNHNNVCPGIPVTFTSNVTNAGAPGGYTVKWFVNSDQNLVQLNGATFTSSTLQNNDQVFARVISGATCSSGATDDSDHITMVVKSQSNVSFSLPSPQTICHCDPAGVGPSFSVTGEPNIVPTYSFTVNGQTQADGMDVLACGPEKVVIQNGSFLSRPYQYMGSGSNTVYTVECKAVYVQSNSCQFDLTRQTTVIVTPPPAFTVGIEVLPNRSPAVYCQDEVSFKANTNMAASLIRWYKNDVNVYNGQVYDPEFYNPSDVIRVEATTNLTCAANNTANRTLNTSVFSIQESVGDVTIHSATNQSSRCQGSVSNAFYTEVEGDNAHSTTWSISNALTSTISQSGLVTWDPAFVGTAAIHVTVTGCGSDSNEDTFYMETFGPPAVTGVVSLDYCEFEPVVLSAPGLEGYKVEWFDSHDTSLGYLSKKNMGRLPAGNYSFSAIFADTHGCKGLRVPVQVSVDSDCDDKLNWIEDVKYSDAGTVSKSRQYFDLSGTLLQEQAISFSQSGQVMASQSLHDQFNRPVASTLIAPLNRTTFQYCYGFVRDDRTPQVFDPVNTSTRGTLGWYYSVNNDMEKKVPTTVYPYSRVDYYNDGTSEVRRSASQGDEHRMGMNHEKVSGTFPVYNELDHYIKKRKCAVLGIQQTIETLKSNAVQTLICDENRKLTHDHQRIKNFGISVADKSGHVIMTAMPGTEHDFALKVDNDVTSHNNDPQDANYRPITYFYLLKDTVVSIETISGNFVVEDILNDTPVGPTFSNNRWPAGLYRIILNSESSQIRLKFTNLYKDVTYQFYNDAGRVVASVSPNGVLDWEGGPVSARGCPVDGNGSEVDASNKSYFDKIEKTTFRYNFQGWLLSQTEFDAGETHYLYRKDGKIRFSQNALQANLGRFAYTNYDEKGRAIESGEYLGVVHHFSALSSQLEFEDQINFPDVDKVDWVRTYYDSPVEEDRELSGLVNTTNLPSSFMVQKFTRGAVLKTANQNSRTWYSYDDAQRVTWMVQKPLNLNMTFVVKYEYDFQGNVIRVSNLAYNKTKSDGPVTEYYHQSEYDADNRLKKVYTYTANSADPKLRATYSYYLHGPLKRMELGNNLQGVDFVYNINGWLTQINHPDRDKDPGEDANDAFGMIINYYETEVTAPALSGLDPTKRTLKFHNLPVDGDDSPVRVSSLVDFYKQNRLNQELPWKRFSGEQPEYKILVEQWMKTREATTTRGSEKVIKG